MAQHVVVVGLIGYGKIGSALATNMLEAGRNMLVYDRDPLARSKAVEAGVEVTETLKDLARAADVVISVLPNDVVLTAVIKEVLEEFKKGTVHVSCSTISPDTARAMSELLATVEVSYVSAPVFARPDGLAQKQATFNVSGSSEGVAVAKDLLSCTSTGIYEFGSDPGAANVVKLCGNFLIASAIESMAESLALAEKNGVARTAVMKMLNSTIFDCLIYKGYGQRVSENDHTPYENAHFSLDLGRKDVRLVRELAQNSGCEMPFCDKLQDRFNQAVDAGKGDLDWSAINLEVRKSCGLADIEPKPKAE